ncbi:MAG: sigma-70 family RNA polymerase sigma factor [Planctomycetes bacterium]|nr:sigma-70 family RNA polymerase sigma factor [Planctomycetota bacterium]
MPNEIVSCTHCPLRSGCQSPCDAVEALLPKEQRGELRRLRRRDSFPYALELEQRRAWVRLLLDWRHHLRGRLKQVFDLHFNDGLSNVEIARQLGLTRGTVSEYLSRATAVLQDLMYASPDEILSEPH